MFLGHRCMVKEKPKLLQGVHVRVHSPFYWLYTLWTYMKPCRKVYMHIEINMRIYSTMSGYQGVLWWAYAIGPLGQHHGTQCETTARNTSAWRAIGLICEKSWSSEQVFKPVSWGNVTSVMFQTLSLSIRGHLKWNHSGHPKWGHHYYPKWDFKGHPKWDHHYWHPKRVGKGIQTGTITSIMGSIGATEVLTTSTGI